MLATLLATVALPGGVAGAAAPPGAVARPGTVAPSAVVSGAATPSGVEPGVVVPTGAVPGGAADAVRVAGAARATGAFGVAGVVGSVAAAGAQEQGPRCSPDGPERGGVPAVPPRTGGEHAQLPAAGVVPGEAGPRGTAPLRVLVRGPDRPAPGPVELSVLRV
ncbi:hypothetical protein ACFXPI_18550 [Streptomyces sp. NPDC059104]|uniref:hypothetical protein n=1 Tax=Streptomyces sp. NPDC059104 TaxID=3346729 RepID=UPI003678150A